MQFLFVGLTLSFAIASSLVAAENALPEQLEVICGPDIVTVGDAWENVKVELAEMERIFTIRVYVRWPQHMAALLAHLRFMERKGIMLFGKSLQQVNIGVELVAEQRQMTNGAALNEDEKTLKLGWEQLQAAVRLVAKQFPEEALIPTVSLAHLLPPDWPVLHLKAEMIPAVIPGKATKVIFRLFVANDQPVALDQLILTHESRLHAIIADQTLSDYHHEHPVPTGNPGEYTFTFTPRLNGHYRLWLNSVPVRTGREEFSMLQLTKTEVYISAPKESQIVCHTAKVKGLRGELSLPESLVEGEISAARLTLTDEDGTPVKNLESLMGAFAHLVGISANYYNILHIHPHGATPQPGEYGGPEIEFRLRPTKSGFVKLFVQVQIEGKIQCLGFGLNVEPANKQ